MRATLWSGKREPWVNLQHLRRTELAKVSIPMRIGLRSASLQNDRSIIGDSRSAHNREGHEFHSCRTGLWEFSAFSRYGSLCSGLEEGKPQRLKPQSKRAVFGTSEDVPSRMKLLHPFDCAASPRSAGSFAFFARGWETTTAASWAFPAQWQQISRPESSITRLWFDSL